MVNNLVFRWPKPSFFHGFSGALWHPPVRFFSGGVGGSL